jgi:hypothetical protein
MEFISAKKNLNEYMWMGVVDDNVDPKRRGRLKIRVQSLFDDIATEDIPWACPYNDRAGKMFSIPAVGKIVNVVFYNDNIYEPYYIFSENYNINLRNMLNSYSDDEYKNFLALAFDDRTQIYSDDTNLTLDYKFNKITISNDNINLELKDNRQKLNIGSDNAGQQAVLGNHWFEWMDKFVNTLLQPSSLIGNVGTPILKPQIDQLLLEYQTIRKTFVSDYVNIVDNGKVKKIQRKVKTDASSQDRFLTINKNPIHKAPEVPEETKETIITNNQKNVESIKNSLPQEVVTKEVMNITPKGYENEEENIQDFKTIDTKYYKYKQ